MSFVYAFIPAAVMCFFAALLAFIYKPDVELKENKKIDSLKN
jgi:hypothetical protein